MLWLSARRLFWRLAVGAAVAELVGVVVGWVGAECRDRAEVSPAGLPDPPWAVPHRSVVRVVVEECDPQHRARVRRLRQARDPTSVGETWGRVIGPHCSRALDHTSTRDWVPHPGQPHCQPLDRGQPLGQELGRGRELVQVPALGIDRVVGLSTSTTMWEFLSDRLSFRGWGVARLGWGALDSRIAWPLVHKRWPIGNPVLTIA